MKYRHLNAVSELQLSADLGGFLFVLEGRKFFCLTVAYIQSLHCSMTACNLDLGSLNVSEGFLGHCIERALCILKGLEMVLILYNFRHILHQVSSFNFLNL